jgi:hypothetical protein
VIKDNKGGTNAVPISQQESLIVIIASCFDAATL